MIDGSIVSLNRSSGGVPKLPVREAWVSVHGLEGDWQTDRRHHGGVDRALCLYSLERIDELRAEGHPISPGATGENVTIGGLDWSRVQPGRRLELGDVEVELTDFADPCKTIRNVFAERQFKRISHKLYPGWSRVYARVLREGLLQVGSRVTLIDA